MSQTFKQTIIQAIKNFKITDLKKDILRSDHFILHVSFDGIIEPGKTMTLNQLADIMNKRFDQIEKRLDGHDVILKEYGEILKEHSNILKEYSKILNQHSEILKEHTEIFKRNNLK